MKNFSIFFILFFLLNMNSFCQFRAKMINVINGEERNYSVYSDLKLYRYEFEENNMKGIVIVNPGENKTFILFPENELVHTTTCDGMMSRMNDPVQSYMWYEKYGEERAAGDKEIDSYTCKIKELYQEDSKIFTVWYSDELNFPLKIISHLAEKTYMELKDIEPWKPEASLFIVPKDYTEVDERMRPVIPEPPAPESWEIKVASIPFEGTVSRGIKLEIKVDKTVYHKMLISNDSGNPSKIIRHLIRNGQELPDNEQGPLKYRTTRLYSGEKKTYTFDWKAGDVVIVEVYEGNMNMKIYPE